MLSCKVDNLINGFKRFWWVVGSIINQPLAKRRSRTRIKLANKVAHRLYYYKLDTYQGNSNRIHKNCITSSEPYNLLKHNILCSHTFL